MIGVLCHVGRLKPFAFKELPSSPIVLTKKLKAEKGREYLSLLLSADERTKLRGRRITSCGKELLLQLPRDGCLLDGDVLTNESTSIEVQVHAAKESLLVVSANTSLELLTAVYHLGNRHVSVELDTDRIFLLEDSVLHKMLRGRGLLVEYINRPFFPELGAYEVGHVH